MLSDDQGAMHFLLATSHLQRWKNEGSVFLDCIVMVDGS